MPHPSESAFPEKTPSRFDNANFTRVQEGTFLDLEYADSPLELASFIDSHYRSGDNPTHKAELLRLQRFAQLASHGLPFDYQSQGAYEIYTGELLALDQGHRLTGTYVHPSDAIQRTVNTLREDVPHYDRYIGKTDVNGAFIRFPRDAALKQFNRNSEWGRRLYTQAQPAQQEANAELRPLHETINKLTENFETRRAEAMKVGFWLVMQHLITPPEQESIHIPAEAKIAEIMMDRRPGNEYGSLSSSMLNEMHPELADITGNKADGHYEIADELFSMIIVKFMQKKTALSISHPNLDPVTTQKYLERWMQEMLKTHINLPIDSSLEVGGDYFYVTKEDSGEDILFNQNQSLSQLRGNFAGFTVQKGYSQRAYVEFRKNGYYTLPDDYEPYIPYVKLTNAFMIDLGSDGQPIIQSFENPVEVPFLYTDIYFSKLTDANDTEL